MKTDQRLPLWIETQSEELRREWLTELGPVINSVRELQVTGQEQEARVILVDSASAFKSTERYRQLSQSGVLILLGLSMEEAQSIDFGLLRLLKESVIDDVVVRPFKNWDFLTRLRTVGQKSQRREFDALSSQLHHTILKLTDDSQLAERLQKSVLPKRFDDLKNMRIKSRYLVGERSGGDFFDIAESRDGSQVSILLTDSTTYGLSSAVLNALMSVGLKLSSDESRNCVDMIRKMGHELSATLGNKSQLSLFYGIFSRKTHELRYLNLGSTSAWLLQPQGGIAQHLLPQGPAIDRGFGLNLPAEQKLSIQTGSRLFLLSDGFTSLIGSNERIKQIISEPKEDSTDILNELVYQVRRDLPSSEDLPAQDCSAIVFDFHQLALKIAS